jgi:hypothetical protein
MLPTNMVGSMKRTLRAHKVYGQHSLEQQNAL